jgi:hypothetical protein
MPPDPYPITVYAVTPDPPTVTLYTATPDPFTVTLDAFPPAPPYGAPHGALVEATPLRPCRLIPDADLVISDEHGRNPGPLFQGKPAMIQHPVRLTVPNGHAASVHVEPMAA